jgi:phosphopantothenoylcysteine decarboxylase/phosphopantothenate--cysteine ligase
MVMSGYLEVLLNKNGDFKVGDLAKDIFMNKKITVSITGGIAAYKAAELVSWLKQSGAIVQVAMTKAACQFITPLTMQALSGRPVATDIFETGAVFNIPHIDIADADLFIVVPATANMIAKAAHGIADDLISAALLATHAPVVFAPAMHVHMYANVITQENIAKLGARGCYFIEPGEGRLACGTVGRGRLADIGIIKDSIEQILTVRHKGAENGVLQGLNVLISAGPTHEKIDPVRYIANRSSGKMGFALAKAARNAGANVTLVTGPSALTDIPNVITHRVESAAEMYEAIWQYYPKADIAIMAAAVADYRPLEPKEQKIKKSGDIAIELTRTPDILASLGEKKGGRILIGFAAETEKLRAHAEEKLRQKNLDMIVANDITMPGAGFDTDTNIAAIISLDSDGNLEISEWPLMNKTELAAHIIELIGRLPGFRG